MLIECVSLLPQLAWLTMPSNPSSRNDTPPTSVKRQASSEIDVPEPKRSRRDDEIRLASLRLLDAFKPLGIYHSPKQARKIVDDFLDYFSQSL